MKPGTTTEVGTPETGSLVGPLLSEEDRNSDVRLDVDDKAIAPSEEENLDKKDSPISSEVELRAENDKSIASWSNLLSIYDLVSSGVDASQTIYQLVLIRQLARDGKLSDPLALKIPLTLEDSYEIIQRNKDVLEEHMKEKELKCFVGSLDNMNDRMIEYEKQGLSYENGKFKSELCHMGDENHTKGLVYAIIVDELHKEIDIFFRGTATKNDLMNNLKFLVLKNVPNPLSNDEGQPRTVGIHAGFYKYLYRSQDRETNKGPSKYDTILAHVIELCKRYPGFDIYTAGHSLGGALATMLAFSLAVSDNDLIKTPVTCVSVASPKVGNSDFVRAFEHLETREKIRHLRVINDLDVIPMSPVRPLIMNWFFLLFRPSEIYRHVGIQLKLFKGSGGFVISCPKTQKGIKLFLRDFISRLRKFFLSVILILSCCQDTLKNHSCLEHIERVQANKERLTAYTLDEIYDMKLRGKRGILVEENKT